MQSATGRKTFSRQSALHEVSPPSSEEEERQRTESAESDVSSQQPIMDDLRMVLQKLQSEANRIWTSAELAESGNDLVSALSRYAAYSSMVKSSHDLSEALQLAQPNTNWCIEGFCFTNDSLQRGIQKVNQLKRTINDALLNSFNAAGISSAGTVTGSSLSSSSNKSDEFKCLTPIDFASGTKSCQDNWFDLLEGLEKEKQKITDSFISPLLFPKLYGNVAKGLLLYGPAGTGKTFLVKAAVNELQFIDTNVRVLFFAPTAADLKGKYFGDSEKMIRSVFDCASKAACAEMAIDPTKANQSTVALSVIFLDEVETLAGRRDKDPSGFMTTTVNALLQAIDGIASANNVAVVAVTNFPWDLDTAFLRRFTQSIAFELPKPTNVKGLLDTLLSQHLQSLVTGKSFASQLLAACAMTGPTTSGSVPQSRGSCQPPGKFNKLLWKSATYKEYTRGLSDSVLITLSALAAAKNYSQSDINRVFQIVVQAAAKDAEQFNLVVEIPNPSKKTKQETQFLSTKQAPELLYVAANFMSPTELLNIIIPLPSSEASKYGTFFLLKKPANPVLELDNSIWISTRLLPLIPITDVNIRDAYLPLEILDYVSEETFPLILKLSVLITQAHDRTKRFPDTLIDKITATVSLDELASMSWIKLKQHFQDAPEDFQALQSAYVEGIQREVVYYVKLAIPKPVDEILPSVSMGWVDYFKSLITTQPNNQEEEEKRQQQIGSLSSLLDHIETLYINTSDDSVFDAFSDFKDKQELKYLLLLRVMDTFAPIFKADADVLDLYQEEIQVKEPDFENLYLDPEKIPTPVKIEESPVIFGEIIQQFPKLESLLAKELPNNFNQSVMTLHLSNANLREGFQTIQPTVSLADVNQLKEYSKDPQAFLLKKK